MSERIHAISVDVSNRSVRADTHVARDQLHTDHRSRLERGGMCDGRKVDGRRDNPCRGSSPNARNCGANASKVDRVNPLKDNGVARSVRSESKSFALACTARGCPVSPPASISAIGRMPAIGSFENGNAIATAPGKPAIYVNRTTAHSLHDTRSLQRSAAQPSEDNRLLRTGVLQYA